MGKIFLDKKRKIYLDYSLYVDCIPEYSSDTLKKVKILLKTMPDGSPCCTENMQVDAADFEGLAFSIWSVCENCNIELEFVPYKFYKGELDIANLYHGDAVDAKIQHYMRFLYRAWKMKSLYERFTISSENKKEVDDFGKQYGEALRDKCLQYSAPKCEGGINKGNKVTENHLEKWFVLHGEDKESGIGMKLYDQLPCGIFYGRHAGDCHINTEILNSGAIDLWGVNNKGEICIFELKKDDNAHLGIISELFFYSCVIKDILEIGKGKRRSNYRGFLNLWQEEIDKKPVNAFFLVDNVHSFIDMHIEDIIKAMNKRNDKGAKYGHIGFSQKDIAKPNESKFISILRKDWKKYLERLEKKNLKS